MNSTPRNPEHLIRPLVRKLQAYQPGEQPKVRGLVKLNTNENPYGPSPQVLTALGKALDARLRLYPNPTAEPLRQELARFHQCRADQIIAGNGSDELLALATRAFVEPLSGLTRYALQSALSSTSKTSKWGQLEGMPRQDPGIGDPSRYTVQYFQPSYSLYSVLAAIHGARPKPIKLNNHFQLPALRELEEKRWDFEAALTYITTPHAPSGRAFDLRDLEAICRRHRGVLILDEAYVDFAEENALGLALRYPNVLVARTFSKAYSLCFLRVGYLVGNPELISALQKIRDSYNVNGLGQIAAIAALKSLPYYRRNFRRIAQSRAHLSESLRSLGFEVLPSQTNFILVRPPRFGAAKWLQLLRERRILVRWFDAPEMRGFLRISIGAEAETEQLLRNVRAILSATIHG